MYRDYLDDYYLNNYGITKKEYIEYSLMVGLEYT
jgi:hypothetical protein